VSKHKEIKRYACGLDPWDDTLIVSHATLIETDKQFRVKGCGPNDDGPLGPAERMFSRHLGYRNHWDKKNYPTVGYATKNGAVQGFLKHLDKDVEKAEKTLEARKRLRSYAQNQANGTLRTVETET